MAESTAPNPAIGYSLHLKATHLIEDFMQTILKSDFQYLQEILAEAKEHFGRRDSVALLPKTPCMNRKRKRVRRSLDESIDNQSLSSPVRESKVEELCLTPDNKKPTLCALVQTPTETTESKPRRTRNSRNTKSGCGIALKSSDLPEIAAPSPQKNAKKPRGSKAKKTAKSRQQPKRGSRTKAGARQEEIFDQEVNQLEAKEMTPKREIRSKRKTCEDLSETPDNKYEAQEIVTKIPSPLQPTTKKTRSVEVYIPETPEIQVRQTKLDHENAVTVQLIDIGVHVSPVLAPTSCKETDTNPPDEEQNNFENNQVVIVETEPLQVQKKYESPEKVEQEQAISESTVSSTEKLSKQKRCRSSAECKNPNRGNKRKQDSINEAETSTSSSDQDNDMEQAGNKVQKLEDVNKSDSGDAAVSSTVNSPVKEQPRMLRPSRGTRRSSRLSVKGKNSQRKSKARKTKSLIKSSVVVQLSTKTLMPAPRESPEKQEDSDDQHQVSSNTDEVDAVKVILFNDDEANDKRESEVPSSWCNVQSSTPEPKCHQVQKVIATKYENDVDTADVDGNEDDPGSAEDDFHDAVEDIQAIEVQDKKDGSVSRRSTRSSSNETKKSDCHDSQSSSYSTGSEGSHPSQGESSPDTQREETGNKVKQMCDFWQQNKFIKSSAGVIDSFIRGYTPKKVDQKEKTRLMKMAILERQEKEKHHIEQLELQKLKRIETQKKRREEKEKKVAALRAAKAREDVEKREQIEKRQDLRKLQEKKARKEKEKEEELKRQTRLRKKADLDARRKEEEIQRQQKILEKEEEAKRHCEMLQRKAEYEEQERLKKIAEAKRQQEIREQELEREREQEKLRIVREIEEKKRKAREERDKYEKKQKEERDKEDKERRRIAVFLKEKEEHERTERERKAKEDKWRQEREQKYRDERQHREEIEKEKQRLRKFEEQRRAEEARLLALSQHVECYDMTPPPPPRVRSVMTADNYNIDDICSDDSTDDEGAPKKKIPSWAQGAKLKAALINQGLGKINAEVIFGGVAMPNLDEIFTTKRKKRFYQRTSSAHWDSPPLRTLNREGTVI